MHLPKNSKKPPSVSFIKNRTAPFSVLYPIVVGLAFTLSLSGCAGKAGGGWEMPPPVVDTVQAKQAPWTVTYSATGTLEANNKVDLNTEAPGIITQILVREGDFVRSGQVLMHFKADKQLAQVQQAAAGIAASQGGLEQQKADIQQFQALASSAKTRLQQAQSELKRFQSLAQGEFVSQLELDQRRTVYNTAVSDYQSALQQLSSAKARYTQGASTLAQSRSNYRYNLALAGEATIRSPFNGIIGSKYVDLGDYVAPTEKLITVVDPSSFRIQFTVPERYLNELHPGLPVQVKFEGLKNASVTGQLSFIDPVIDADAHTVKVKAVLPAAPGLRHGLLGNVSLALGKIPDAVVIPEEAIVPQGEKSFVYVVKHEIYQPKETGDTKAKPAPAETTPSEVAHLQEVTLGYRETGKVQVQSGLKPGERVIINGLQKVSDNLKVTPDPKPAESGAKGQ